jgi:hypothetical protein
MRQTKLMEFEESMKVKEVHRNSPIQIALVAMNTSKAYHKGHRYLFTFHYDGIQPIRYADKISKFGRYGTVKQARFNYSEDKAIVFSLPHTLKIWVKHPNGARTVEELTEARKTAWRVAESFSRKHGIAITSEKQAGFSEHTIENKPLDNLIRPMVELEPELAKEKLDLSINQTSHKNKVEWTGKKAKDRVMSLERILDGGLDEKLDNQEKLLERVIDNTTSLINSHNWVVDYLKKNGE